MIRDCQEYNLPSPVYRYNPPDLSVEFYNKYTESMLKEKGLKDSYIKIILYVNEKGNVTNSEVQELCNVTKRTASRYLSDLEIEYLVKSGTTGKGTIYTLKGT